jgi:hypothetical protein
MMTGSDTDSPLDYDLIADTYDRRYQVNDYSGVETALIAFVGEHCDQRVLEVGRGIGHWLRSLGDSGIRMTGLDASARDDLHAEISMKVVATHRFGLSPTADQPPLLIVRRLTS